MASGVERGVALDGRLVVLRMVPPACIYCTLSLPYFAAAFSNTFSLYWRRSSSCSAIVMADSSRVVSKWL